MCKEKGRWVAHGMNSFGADDDNCRQAKRPAIHTRILKFTDWIEKETNGKFTEIHHTFSNVYNYYNDILHQLSSLNKFKSKLLINVTNSAYYYLALIM